MSSSSVITELHLKNRNTESPLQCLLYNEFNSKQASNSAYIAEYCATLKYLIEDFHELLQLDMSRFWGKLLSDKSILQSVDSYLTQAPRDYVKIVKSMPEKVRNLHDELHRAVFFILLRCASTKSKQELTTLDGNYHAHLIYDNYIFDVPRLMDFIVLYGAENIKLVHSMVTSVLTKQPRYKDDFLRVFCNLDELLDRVCSNVGIRPSFSMFFQQHHKSFSQRHSLPSNGSSTVTPNHEQGHAKSSAETSWIDALLYVNDIVKTYEALLNLTVPSQRSIKGVLNSSDNTYSPLLPLLIAGNVGMKLAVLYEQLIPHLHQWFQDMTNQRDQEPMWCENETIGQLIARVSYGLIRVANELLRHYHMRDDRGELNLSPAESLEKLLRTWQFIIISFPLFTCASDAVASLRELFHSVQFTEDSSNSTQHDESRVQYLITSIDVIYEEMQQTKPIGFFPYERRNDISSPPPNPAPSHQPSKSHEKNEHREVVSTIRNIFPHITEDVILRCLSQHNYDMEVTIAYLCDFDPQDQEVDQEEEDEECLPSENEAESADYAAACQIDEDEKRQILERYQYEPEEEEEDRDTFNMENLERLTLDELENRWENCMLLNNRRRLNVEMEDEYDDTYDSNISACEKELGAPEKPDVAVSAENQREPTHQNREFRPAYLDKVKGAPRGHGQSADTSHGRHLKEKNKAKVANHNRKYLADKKRRGY